MIKNVFLCSVFLFCLLILSPPTRAEEVLSDSEKVFLKNLPANGIELAARLPSGLWCCVANGVWLVSPAGAAVIAGYYHGAATGALGSSIPPGGGIVLGGTCQATEYCLANFHGL